MSGDPFLVEELGDALGAMSAGEYWIAKADSVLQALAGKH
jgi:hypothetical protein